MNRARSDPTWRFRLAVALALAASGACGSDDAVGPEPPSLPPLTIRTTSLSQAIENVQFSDTLVAAGGRPGYSWTITEGALSQGLVLNGATGVIDGIPLSVGRADFTVRAESADGQAATQRLDLSVSPQPVLDASGDCREAPEYAIVTIEDENLEGAVRDALSIDGAQSLTCARLAEIEQLDAGSRGIRSLAGAQNLVSIQSLDLSRNDSIQDLAPLAGLTGLTGLSLAANDISDITAIGTLTALVSLDLRANRIVDLGALSQLEFIARLQLDSNPISSIEPLRTLRTLTFLTLSNTPIGGADALRELTELRVLVLGVVRDLGPVRQLLRLEWLQFSLADEVTHVQPLSGLANLRTLSITTSGRSRLSSLSPLSGLSLTQLYLWSGGGMVRMRDIGPVGSIESLQRLSIAGYFGITDIRALRALVNLNDLNIRRMSRIGDFAPIGGLTGLTRLDLGTNDLVGIGWLAGLTGLTSLSLRSNRIVDLGPLRGLTSLSTLDLAENRTLSDIQPLFENPGLGQGDHVVLSSTGVPCSRVAALRARGLTVTSSCPGG